MFAHVPGAPSDADRLREIDVANESVHDHSSFISRFLSTHAYASLTSFLHQLNAASTSLSLTQAAAYPHPPSVSAVLALLTRIHGLVDRHPPLPSANTRFGNPAFRDVIADLEQHSRGWLVDMLREGMDVTTLPPLSGGRQRLMDEEASGGSESAAAHSHAHELPQAVLDSMRARGELPNDRAEGQPPVSPSYPADAQPADTDETKEGAEPPSSPVERVADLLSLYLTSSFGDRRRIDYGTGHELHFLCFLYCLTAIHFIPLPTPPPSLPASPPAPSVLSSLSLVIFPRYLGLMRRLQSLYLLEPAGSRGVWGLDDFSFLPFLLGSVQLVGHAHLRPRSMRYREVVDGVRGEWMYVDAVRWVMDVKAVSFAEHSPLLNDITAVKRWEAVNAGLMRMYEAEVLRKYPIIQHFIFTPLLDARLVKPVTRVEVREPDLCCSDSIHFPSALAAPSASGPIL